MPQPRCEAGYFASVIEDHATAARAVPNPAECYLGTSRNVHFQPATDLLRDSGGGAQHPGVSKPSRGLMLREDLELLYYEMGNYQANS